ncbi:MAG: hypothetical protein DCC71_13285 [Proteobacteria bacterium]|nr:MAG: hypothetical protein DCC71_13285 [Pseudomonadota bacterium]
MRREEILDWLRSHREAVRGDPDEVLGRAEHDARRHAAEQAWLHAKRIAERELAGWKQRSLGSHAAENTVALEFCHDLARELRQLEPQVDGDAESLVEPATLGAFAQEARDLLRGWVREVAGEEEHRVWEEVVRFTHARGKSLIREGAMSTASGWEETHWYTETAVRLAAILAHDYEERARSVS